RIGETEVEDVLDRLFAEVVIDPEDRFLGKRPEQGYVQSACRGQAPSKRFLDDDASLGRAATCGKVVDHYREQARGTGQVKKRSLRAGQRGAQAAVCLGVRVVARHVSKKRRELRKCLGIELSVFGDAGPRPIDQLLRRPRRAGDADDQAVDFASFYQRLKRRKDLLVREISAHPAADQSAGFRPLAHDRSTCPPNPNLIADRTRFWKSSSPRDANRSNSAADKTWAGTASSFAACGVQRPATEACT